MCTSYTGNTAHLGQCPPVMRCHCRYFQPGYVKDLAWEIYGHGKGRSYSVAFQGFRFWIFVYICPVLGIYLCLFYLSCFVCCFYCCVCFHVQPFPVRMSTVIFLPVTILLIVFLSLGLTSVVVFLTFFSCFQNDVWFWWACFNTPFNFGLAVCITNPDMKDFSWQ